MNPDPQAWIDLIPWIISGGVAITAVAVFGSIQSTRIKIKNGYPLEGMWGQSLKPDLTSEGMERVKLLTQENASLRAELSSMKDRMANIERIVTDSGYRLSHEIEDLRDKSDAN